MLLYNNIEGFFDQQYLWKETISGLDSLYGYQDSI